MTTLVLVHGGWGGGWCWRDAARVLRSHGHEVYAPTLTGLAERRHIPPEHVNLSTHIADVAGQLVFEDIRGAVLVGHSYGGMVITGATDREPERVAGLIYFDAFLPASGQSLFDLASTNIAATHLTNAERYDGGKSVPLPSSPRTPPAPDVLDYAPYTPQPIETMREKWTSVRDRQTWPRRHYILCTAYKDSPFHTIASNLRGPPDWTMSEIDAFHDVIYVQPPRTAAAIEDALTSLELA
jgi:pimeloyl-ACP methyl ester carboxylesterase